MAKRRTRSNAGMTLLEITLAVSIFAVAVGITAQSLVSYYMTMDMHEQQIESAQAARTIIAAIRDKRGEFDGDPNFPVGLQAWVAAQQDDGWSAFLRTKGTGDTYAQLEEHSVTVNMAALDGGAVAAGTNPVRITVVSEWNDRRGRPMSATIATVLTDE